MKNERLQAHIFKAWFGWYVVGGLQAGVQWSVRKCWVQ